MDTIIAMGIYFFRSSSLMKAQRVFNSFTGEYMLVLDNIVVSTTYISAKID